MASVERTVNPRFKRAITARELHVSFTPEQAEPRDRILTWRRATSGRDQLGVICEQC
ncbi:UNVERIFIED_CONTAM: hypothetical protein RKD43_006759 [Streptomyces graminofaciens]